MILVTSESMQELDRRTISTLRVPGIVLMDHAGKALAGCALVHRPERVVVVCGKGNNGGDGWSAARWLAHAGVADVQVVSTVDPQELSGDAKTQAESALARGVRGWVYESGRPLPPADVYIDALLGTGAKRAPTGRLGELVGALEAASGWVIAADVPTGVDASTGEVPGLAVHADETVSMAAQKLGTAVSPGCHYAGKVHVADIGIDLAGAPSAQLVEDTDVALWLPARTPDSHKGSFGRIAVVVGEMTGAAQLAGLGAARVGAGLVVLGVLGDPLQGAPLEFVVRQASGPESVADCDALVLGPGLGRALDVAAQWPWAFAGKAVIDADGLRLLRTGDGFHALPGGRFVLTPHPKECGRLLDWPVGAVQQRRLAAAQTAARETGAVVVLKGYHSVIAHPDGRIRINPTGDAALATAGTGDVLAGVIGGLLAAGLTPFDAASAGAWLHGRAGELAGAKLGAPSVLASDVVDGLSGAICAVQEAAAGQR